MPYDSTSELPESVKGVLPEKAQRMWMHVFNSAQESGDDEDTAIRKAWAQVKTEYKKDEDSGKWVKKMSDDVRYVPFADRGDGWFLYFPLGTIYHHGKKVDFGPDDAREMVNNFKVHDVPGYSLPVNLRHDDSYGVYGYISDLRFSGSEVQWKPSFREDKKEEIKSLGYKYFSPEIWFKGYQARDGNEYNNVAMGGGLTPRPRLGRQASVAIFSEDDGWEYTVKQTLLDKLMDKVDKLLSFADKYECECPECGHKMESESHCKDTECPECGASMRREDRPSNDTENVKESEDMGEVAEKVSQSVIERIDSWFNERFGENEEDFSEELESFKDELAGEFNEQMTAKEEQIAELSEAKEALETKAQELEEKFAEEERKRRLAEFTDTAEELGVPVETQEFGEVLMRFHDSDDSEEKADYEMLLSVLKAKGNIQETDELFGEKGSDADEGDNLEKFSALVKERMEKTGESWGKASEHVMEERPELYKEYNEEVVKASNSDDVGDNVEVV